MILSNRLFGTVPYPASTAGSGGFASRLLAEIAMRELRDQIEPTLQPLGTLGIHFSQILVLPDVSSQASELARQLRAAFSRG